MKLLNLLSISAFLFVLTGCVPYPIYPVYSSTPVATRVVTTSTYYSAPSYVQGIDGSVEPAPNGTIYWGRTAPEPVYQTYQYAPPYTSQPIYQQGYNQPNYITPNSSNSLGAATGAIAGGLLGATVGRGNGRVAASAIGAATGTVIGSGCRNITGGQVIGGLAGGLLGATVGKGNGQVAAAALGAAGGAAIGNNMGGC